MIHDDMLVGVRSATVAADIGEANSAVKADPKVLATYYEYVRIGRVHPDAVSIPAKLTQVAVAVIHQAKGYSPIGRLPQLATVSIHRGIDNVGAAGRVRDLNSTFEAGRGYATGVSPALPSIVGEDCDRPTGSHALGAVGGIEGYVQHFAGAGIRPTEPSVCR